MICSKSRSISLLIQNLYFEYMEGEVASLNQAYIFRDISYPLFLRTQVVLLQNEFCAKCATDTVKDVTCTTFESSAQTIEICYVLDIRHFNK